MNGKLWQLLTKHGESGKKPRHTIHTIHQAEDACVSRRDDDDVLRLTVATSMAELCYYGTVVVVLYYRTVPVIYGTVVPVLLYWRPSCAMVILAAYCCF